jgi:hypothetical protein
MLATTLAIALSATPFVDFEAGVAFAAVNDVAIPGDTGTRLSFTDDLTTDPAPVARLRIGAVAGRHTFFALAAPLRLSSTGSLPYDVTFRGTTFSAGTRVQANYRFDSWRATWRYGFVRSSPWELDGGLTVKIRDAAIGMAGPGGVEEKTNVGVVPLLSFRVAWWASPFLGLLLDGDALVGPNGGRAEDVLLAVQWRVREGTLARVGYRLLEGGADAVSVYNFALVHYATAGLLIEL